MNATRSKQPSFSLRLYFHVLPKLLGHPREFFSETANTAGWRQALGFLLVSSMIFAGAFLLNMRPEQPVLTSGILLANAIGMTVIASGTGYMIMVMIMGRHATFGRLFNVYAYASGITLLASWLPFFLFLTEPWKWWLIGTGLKRHAGFESKHVAIIVTLSILTMIALFVSLVHLTAAFRK